MNKKHGFTLSELLMSIAIIAVVSAMGITIAKRNTDDAYKTYFAVGTMNLNNALAQIETGNVNVRPNAAGDALEIRTNNAGAFIPGDPDDDIFSISQFAQNEGRVNGNDFRGPQWITNNLKYLFGDTNIKNNPNLCGQGAHDCVINAPNGITYEILSLAPLSNNIEMRMIVPAPRRRINGNIVDRVQTVFLYDRNVVGNVQSHNVQVTTPNGVEIQERNIGNSQMLIPLHTPINRGLIVNQNLPFVSLQDRQDLLTAYIDNGTVGRHIDDQFSPIRYGTFRDAICTILSDQGDTYDVSNITYAIDGVNILLCYNNNQLNNNLPVQQDAIDIARREGPNGGVIDWSSSGVIKFASPRKLK